MAAFQFPGGPREEDVPVGEILAGKYRVERVVGAGGMGVVVRVSQLEGEGAFALKFLRPSVARDALAAKRFLREAEAARRIEDLHVVKIPDVGQLESGSPYLVMEYLEGSTLEARLTGGQRLPLSEACDLAFQVVEGLAAAHAMGVIHRDIKPANLYLTSGPEGTVLLKIVDFGVSKILDPEGPEGPSLTCTQTAIGSPLYMSPEQMRSARTADYRTDQWSLGAVLYRMVTGQRPFDADSLPRLCLKVLEGDFVPIATLRPELPADFAPVVERCLRVPAAERYADVAELASALAPFVGPAGRERADRCRAVLAAGRRPTASGGVPVVGPSEPTS